MNSKKCSACESTKPLSEFYNHKGNPDGKTYKCGVCMRAVGAAYRATPEGSEYHKVKAKERRESDEGKESAKRYWASPKGIKTARRNAVKPATRARIRAYNKSDLAKSRTESYRERYPLRVRANRAVKYQVKRGYIRPAADLVCDQKDDSCYGRNNYHHDSYLEEDRLNVRCLCMSHHKRWHKTNTPTPHESEVFQ